MDARLLTGLDGLTDRSQRIRSRILTTHEYSISQALSSPVGFNSLRSIPCPAQCVHHATHNNCDHRPIQRVQTFVIPRLQPAVGHAESRLSCWKQRRGRLVTFLCFGSLYILDSTRHDSIRDISDGVDNRCQNDDSTQVPTARWYCAAAGRGQQRSHRVPIPDIPLTA